MVNEKNNDNNNNNNNDNNQINVIFLKFNTLTLSLLCYNNNNDKPYFS